MSHARAVPADRWFAMTLLDQNRARRQLANKAGVDVTRVTNMAIWGNHSTTMYPDFYNARIGGRPGTRDHPRRGMVQGHLSPGHPEARATIIEARGASSAASAPTPSSIRCARLPPHGSR